MISVISPTYNCSEYVLRSYNCLKEQTFNDWEWIIVDDGSTDNTEQIICELSKTDVRIKYFKLDTNRGRGYARNKALEKSEGSIIVIWDIDDLYPSNRLIKIYDKLDQGYDYFCSYVLLVNRDINIKGARHFYKTSMFSPSFVHPTLAFKKELLLNENIKYDKEMRAGEDLAIMLELENKYKGYYCEEYLMLYVEDREVNIDKALNANINQYKSIKKIISNKKDNFNTSFKIILKLKLKIFILFILKLFPGLYLKSVKLRYSDVIFSKKLSPEIMNILNNN